MQSEDRRLDRLLDYTKFHIGIYLSIGGGLVALLGSNNITYVQNLIGCPKALVGGLFFMAIAGLAGGIIASSCASCCTFKDFWENPQAPYMLNWLIKVKGQTWTFIEHWSFWIGLGLITYAVLSAGSVYAWVMLPHPKA